MSLYWLAGEVVLSESELDKIAEYLRLINDDVGRADDPEQQRYILSILEAFDHCPKRAAQAYNDAYLKADAAMVAYYEEIVAKSPFPAVKNFLMKFENIETGKAQWEALKEESLALWRDILEQEFYSVIESFHRRKWKSHITLN